MLIGERWQVYIGDWIVGMQELPDDSVSMGMTSVPYWSLRDYGVDGQLGLEPHPSVWIAAIVDGLREFRRILHPSGTLWVNCGDAYAQGGRGGQGGVTLQGSRKNLVASRAGLAAMGEAGRRAPVGFKNKDLLMLPARLAIALQEDGWYLRSQIVWAKTNPMPESIKDRPTKAHELLYLLSKRPVYFYDNEAIREPYKPESLTRRAYGDNSHVGDRIGSFKPGANPPGASEQSRARGAASRPRTNQPGHTHGLQPGPQNHAYLGVNPAGRNRRDVWTTSTARFDGEHTATFPEELVEPAVLAGTSAKGVCPRCRAPWARVVEKGAQDKAWVAASGANRDGEYHGVATKDYAAAGAQDPSAVKARILAGMRERKTVAWVPTCGCSPLEAPFRDFIETGNIAFAEGHPVGIISRLLFWEKTKRRDVRCADPTCQHPSKGHGKDLDACGRCRCGAFRWGDPYEPVPAVVYDPFSGMHTTGLVAVRLGRRYMGTELNPKYALAGAQRLRDAQLVRDFGGADLTPAEKRTAGTQQKLFEG